MKLSGKEHWKDGDELTLLHEWFQCACEIKRSIYVIGPCGGLKGLLALCDGIGEESCELIGSELEVSESRLISCGV